MNIASDILNNQRGLVRPLDSFIESRSMKAEQFLNRVQANREDYAKTAAELDLDLTEMERKLAILAGRAKASKTKKAKAKKTED